MRLSNKTLTKFVKGAVFCHERDGYLNASRYSRAQIEMMQNPAYDRGWRNRSVFTGGVRLEFRTDAEHLSFDYRASDMHERSNTVDLYINGTLTAVYEIGDRLKGKVEFSMPAGRKTVTVYYPCESRFEIKHFEIDGGYESVKDKGPRLLVLGDSITQGAGPQIASAAYLHGLTRKTGYTVLGQGIGGYRYEPCDLMKIDGFEPDKILVFLGTNYYEKACEERGYNYARAVKEYYERLTALYPNIPILCVTPLWRNNDTNWERFLWCIDRIKEACAPHPNVLVADGFELMPNVDVCLSDGVHPSTYGSELLAANLARFMKEHRF